MMRLAFRSFRAITTAGLLLTVLSGVHGSDRADEAAGAVAQESARPLSVLAVRKFGDKKSERLKFLETITESEKGSEHLCMCRAILFRMLQLAAQRRNDNVLDVNEIDSVRTGWTSHASEEVFCDILQMPKERLSFSTRPVKLSEPVVRRAWWELNFSDKSTITLVATTSALPADFLKLRAQHKKGDNSEATMSALQARKAELVETLSVLPLEQLIVVRMARVAHERR